MTTQNKKIKIVGRKDTHYFQTIFIFFIFFFVYYEILDRIFLALSANGCIFFAVGNIFQYFFRFVCLL
jgi:hypothetical protein